MKKKEERELVALKKLEETFGQDLSWIHETIEKYESLDTKEARFVKVLDKVMPKLTVVLNGGASLHKRSIQRAEVEKTFDLQRTRLQELAYDMPELMALWEHFVTKELGLIKN